MADKACREVDNYSSTSLSGVKGTEEGQLGSTSGLVSPSWNVTCQALV
jgi:hypothetical protein